MTWREELRPASFRAVPFHVEGDGGTFGRRTQTHEYPQRDKPYTEDLGRATRTFEITAFLIGDDYLRQRDALLEAIETEGPGTLVHPWYGQLTVSIQEPARVSHSMRNGGMCEVSLSFVEAGELQFPTASTSLGAQSLIAIDAVEAASGDDFLSDFKVAGFPAFVSEQLVADLTEFIGVAGGYLDGLHQILRDPLGTLLELAGLPGNPITAAEEEIGLPQSLLDAVLGLYYRSANILGDLFGSSTGSTDALNRNAVIALSEMSAAFGSIAVAPTSAAPATYQAQRNRYATAVLFQRSALIQAAGMTSAMVIPVYDDANLIRTALTSAIDDAALAAADDVYVPLQTLRTRVHADLTARMTNAARLRDFTPRAVMPALVLAYDLYEDPMREIEIVQRNAVRHPGFLPAEPLKVLSA